MRRPVMNAYLDLLTQPEVLQTLSNAPGQHVAFVGAGVSSEADVPLASQICEEIRALLEVGRSEQDLDAWARDKLSWDVAGSSKTS